MAVDRSNPLGLRDYAILLLMSTYGFGAGEIIRLQFQDIDWDSGTLSVLRPKTESRSRCPYCRPSPRRWRSTYATVGPPIHPPAIFSCS
jgi:integrase